VVPRPDRLLARRAGWLELLSDGPIACFVDPVGARSLWIDPALTTDPVADASRQERRPTEGGVLPGYRLIRLQRALLVAGADGEFRFRRHGGRYAMIADLPALGWPDPRGLLGHLGRRTGG
jgi:hypothetical protein